MGIPRTTISTLVRLGAVGSFVYLLYYLREDDGSKMSSHSDVRPVGDLSLHRLNVAENNIDEKHFYDILHDIAVPRVVGTPGHKSVQERIKTELNNLGWHVTADTFVDKTPIFGKLQFENIIATLNPNAKEVVVLSCHYDSKYFPGIEFIGATDSAVPCSMLLNLAHCLQKELNLLKTADLTLELWFFDGEEAFDQWGPLDSLYGARHLATKMKQNNSLSRIKCLVLLDLLGVSDPVVFNYYNEGNIFKHLSGAEEALSTKGLVKGPSVTIPGSRSAYFTNRNYPHFVEDDHTPFLQKGVPVVHIIPAIFPKVWHTPQDNLDVIDKPTIKDLNKILRLFTLNFFNLH